MKIPSRNKPEEGLPGISGTARVDRRTQALVHRLRRGDIAVIDHLDLDRTHADALVESGVRVVVNAAPFISGRYPNQGPQLLARSGIVMLDDVGDDVFAKVRDGQQVRVHDGHVFVKDEPVVTGRVLSADDVAAMMDAARDGLTSQLQSFTHNTTEFLRREQELLLNGQGAPHTRTRFEGRPVVVVVRGYDYREDLRRLRRYIREQRPVLVGVDSGADVLLAAGHRPDVLVVGADGLSQGGRSGDGGVSDKALRTAREVVLHTDRAGHASGSDRLDRIGVRSVEFSAGGATEDVAMLLADLSGASLIVTVGTHATLDEFLDSRRAGLASTFLTRLRVGSKFVDAKGVSRLYRQRISNWQLAWLALAGVLALIAALAATAAGQTFLGLMGAWFDSVWSSLGHTFGGGS